MSQKSQDAVDVLSKVIVDTIDKKLDTANFDKSQTGVVTAVNGNTYTISVFGSQYNITSDQIFTVGQSVVVTALQGDMKRLVCSPDNIGTMKTVDNKVKVVGDKLSSFIDKDFADTVNRIDQIKGQVDKSFMSWFYDGAPTLENAPAKDWTTEDAKRVHIGDLYYDTTNGYSYEWVVNDGVYSWNKITDSGIQEALKNASKAQDTADGKRRIFYDTPSTPYDKGDMWAQGNAGDILICQVARVITDSYNRTDWVVASKYTDDTVANRAEDKADNAQSSADKANNDLASFKTEYDSDLKVTKEQIEARVTATTYSEDMSGLKRRVSSAESKISQNADAITLRATKEELATAKSDAISAAASDASTKANAAQNNAKAYTDAQLKITSESITSTVSKTYATQESLNNTNNNVFTAQITADNALSGVNSLGGRVSSAETKISQNSDAITFCATKAEASSYAASAEQNAKNELYSMMTFTADNGLVITRSGWSGKVQITGQNIQVVRGNNKVVINDNGIDITDGYGSVSIYSGGISFHGIRNSKIFEWPYEKDSFGNPIGEFTAQTTKINLSSYSSVMLVYDTHKEGTWFASGGGAGRLTVVLPVNGQTYSYAYPWNTIHWRTVKVSDTGITFGMGNERTSSYSGTTVLGIWSFNLQNPGGDGVDKNDGVCRPLELYGFM